MKKGDDEFIPIQSNPREVIVMGTLKFSMMLEALSTLIQMKLSTKEEMALTRQFRIY